MLSPRLTNCPECANIPSLLKKIDCKLAELGNNLYNNISYMLNKPIPAGDILQLIAYRRILTYKYCNPNYVYKYSVQMIASRVIRLTAGCVSRCNEPERCLEEPCDITIVLNPTTTSTSTLPVSTTTSTSSTSSTTTTSSSSTSTTTTTTTIVTPTTTTTTTVVINDITEINIWFDSSGSMDETLAPLQVMRNTLLKACIGPIYGYDPLVIGSDALYNERVKIFENPEERFVSWLNTSRNYNRSVDTSVNQVLNFTFEDESDPYGYGTVYQPFDNTIMTTTYSIDIITLRNNVLVAPYIKGIAFQVNTGPNAFPGFRGLTQATFVDTGIYVSPFNLSDLSQFSYELDVVAASTPAYYLNKIVSGLNTLGFSISCNP